MPLSAASHEQGIFSSQKGCLSLSHAGRYWRKPGRGCEPSETPSLRAGCFVVTLSGSGAFGIRG